MNHFIVLLYFFNEIVYFVTSNVRALDAKAIIGGDYAEDDQFKYQVFLEFCDYFCGGAIIAENFVLTAAHCVLDIYEKFRTTPIKVVAGTIDLNTKKGAVEVNVDTIYIYKKNNRLEGINDIAVLKLKENLGLAENAHLEKINLPTSDDTYDGEIAIVSGYGFIMIKIVTIPGVGITVERGYTDKLLKYAAVKIIDNEECRRKVHPRSTNICGRVVQRENRPEGICSGDSGGPLVYNKTIIGIAISSPLGCREDREFAVYTRVSTHVSFIRNILKGHPTNAKQHTIDANSSCDNRKRIRH